MRRIILIAHNLRSCHNIGSLLRTAEGLGVEMVYLTGYTPYPMSVNDVRLPHIAKKVDQQISKTALGAESSQAWEQQTSFTAVAEKIKSEGFQVVALEQTADSIKLPDYNAGDKIALVVGREVDGIEPEILNQCGMAVEIPMFGQKESFNVVQAAAMALYHCRFN